VSLAGAAPDRLCRTLFLALQPAIEPGDRVARDLDRASAVFPGSRASSGAAPGHTLCGDPQAWRRQALATKPRTRRSSEQHGHQPRRPAAPAYRCRGRLHAHFGIWPHQKGIPSDFSAGALARPDI